jgi:hypothetical protein
MTGVLLASPAGADGPPPALLLDWARPGVELLSLGGNSSVLRISPWIWQDGTDARPCTTIHLRARGSIAGLEVTTTGLGHAQLANVPDPSNACNTSLSLDWRERLQLSPVGDPGMHDWVLAVSPDATALASPGTAMEGQVVAFAPSVGMVAVPLKLERLPLSSALTALLWTLGVVLPALLAYVLGRAADRWNERRKLANEEVARQTAQAEAFAAWRQEPAAQISITDVISEVGTLIATPGVERPCARVLKFMYERGMLAKMPSEERRQIIDVCTREERKELLDLMPLLFPELQADIPTTWG